MIESKLSESAVDIGGCGSLEVVNVDMVVAKRPPVSGGVDSVVCVTEVVGSSTVLSSFVLRSGG